MELREAINNFEGLFFAFNQKQFMAGGFILKSRVKAWEEMLSRYEA